MIFFGGPSASGNSSDSSTGNQKRRSNSPMPVPGPLSVRNLLSSARSMAASGFVLAFAELGAGQAGRQRRAIAREPSAEPDHRAEQLQPQRLRPNSPAAL